MRQPSGEETYPDICPTKSAAADMGDVPARFSTPGNQPQLSWAEGNHLKLFGCKGHCDGTNCNSMAPGYRNEGWHLFLSISPPTAPRRATRDLWASQRAVAKAMLGRFVAWQETVVESQGPAENGCGGGPSRLSDTAPYSPPKRRFCLT